MRHLGRNIKRGVKKVANVKPIKTLVKDVAPAAIGIAVGAETENPYAGLAAQEAAQQGVNRLYGKGMSTVSIKASDAQLSKLRNGKGVRILSGATRDLVVKAPTARKINNAFKRGKGVNVRLDKEEIDANKTVEGKGIFSKKNLRKGLKVIGKEVLKEAKKEGKKALSGAVDAAGNAIIAEVPIAAPIVGIAKKAAKKSGNKAIDNVDKKKSRRKSPVTIEKPTEAVNLSLADVSISDLEKAIANKRQSLGLSRKTPQYSASSGKDDEIMGNSFGEGLYAGKKYGSGLYVGAKSGAGLFAGRGVDEYGSLGIGGTLVGYHSARLSRPDLYNVQGRYAM